MDGHLEVPQGDIPSPSGAKCSGYFFVSAQHLSSVADRRVMCDAQYCNLSRDMPYDCCFVNVKKAFDTVARGLLWQVLETAGIRGPILDCIKSLYSHDSAAVRTQEGISDIFDCLMGVKQGCPLSAMLFGLFVDGLEQHPMDTLGHDAPFLSGVLIPLLLYADDLTIVSTTPAGPQRQLNALQFLRATAAQRQSGQKQGVHFWLQS